MATIVPEYPTEGELEVPQLTSTELVGVIVGIAGVATILVILLSVGSVAIRRWLTRRHHGTRDVADVHDLNNSRSREAIILTSQTLANTDEPDVGQELDTFTSNNKPSYTEDEILTQKRHSHLGVQQFPRADLLLLEFLGEGTYGPVYRGEAYGLGTTEGSSRVVTVKMLSQSSGEAKKIRFEQDIALLSTMNHTNVIGMLAVCTEDSPECILLDAGRPGDLLQYIRDKRRLGQRQSSAQSIVEDSFDFIKISDEVSIGMAFLASQQFVNKDLALRNCIISYDGTVKIANFGLGPVNYPEAYHRIQDRSIPIRWMPPEGIASCQFTLASDIWSFGILMWELFSYGELPYPDKSNEDVIHYVGKEFGTPAMPEGCMEDAYLVMCSCWEVEPLSRSPFLTLHEHLSELKSELSQRLQ